MPDLLETRQCPNCRGELTLVLATQRQRCEQCGNEYVAQPAGLVYFGPEQLAAEAAIQYLTAEVAEIEAEIQAQVGAWEQAKVAIEHNERKLREHKGRVAEMRQQLAAAQRFHSTTQFGLFYLPVFGLFFWQGCVVPRVLRPSPPPTFADWIVVGVSLVFFLYPLSYVLRTDLNKISKLPRAISAAEADAKRDHPALAAQIEAARAAAGLYPTDKVEALRAEIAEKQRQMALHYEVIAN